MNPWAIGAAALSLALIPCGIAVLILPPLDRVIALSVAGTAVALVLALLALAQGRPGFLDVALVVALLTYGACYTFLRFLEQAG